MDDLLPRSTLTAQELLSGIAALKLEQYILLEADGGISTNIQRIDDVAKIEGGGEIVPCQTEDGRLCLLILPTAEERSESVLTAGVILLAK